MHVNRGSRLNTVTEGTVKGCGREPPETSTVVKRAAAVAPSLAWVEGAPRHQPIWNVQELLPLSYRDTTPSLGLRAFVII